MVRKISRYKISGTTDATGAATLYSKPFTGKILAIIAKVSNLDATADTTITSDGEIAAQSILTLTNVNTDAAYYPRVPMQSSAGVNLVYAAAGEIVPTEFVVAGRLKFVVAQGGASKDVEYTALVEEY